MHVFAAASCSSRRCLSEECASSMVPSVISASSASRPTPQPLRRLDLVPTAPRSRNSSGVRFAPAPKMACVGSQVFLEDSPFPAHVSKRPGVQRTLGFAKHTTFFGTVHAAIQQTNATLTPSMHRFSSQTPPWHGAYIDSADKRHLGTVHAAIQQTNATLAPHMCIFSGHAPGVDVPWNCLTTRGLH